MVGDVQTFVADNRETLGTTSDKLASVTQALTDSLDDVKQFLHVAPNTLQNYVNIYQPAQGAVSSVPVVNNFANPISFLCGAMQAASRLGAEQSAKLCVQYLAPIVKNRQYNFLPARHRTCLRRRPRPGPTSSPTARTGCARITFRRSHRRRRRPPADGRAPAAAAGPPLAAEAPMRHRPGRRPARA